MGDSPRNNVELGSTLISARLYFELKSPVRENLGSLSK